MNRFQEALQRRLLPSFESLCQSCPPGSLSVVLIQHSGCLTKNEAIDLCPHKPPKTELGSYKAERVAYRKIDSKPPTFWTWRTCYRLSQDDDAWAQYVTLATEAGGCVRDWATRHGISSDTIATRYDGFRWLYGLFDLAWAGHDQFPMHSDQVYLLRDRLTDAALQRAFYESCYRVNTEEDNTTPEEDSTTPEERRDAFIRKAKEAGIDIAPHSLPDLDSLAKRRLETLARLDKEIGELQSLGYWSVLADVARASLYAIDVLTDGTFAPQGTESGKGTAASRKTGKTSDRDEIENRLKRLESRQKSKKPKTEQEKIRKQRLDFCVPRRKKGDTWSKIYVDYIAQIRKRKTYISDPKASPDTIRQMCEAYHSDLKG